MKQIIISTVGVSMLRLVKDREKLKQVTGISAKKKQEFAEPLNHLIHELTEHALQNSSNPKLLGAEPNSLDKMNVKKGDQLFFLTSYTLEGILVGEVLSRISVPFWNVNAEYESVIGLQVHDVDYFCYIGLPNLVKKVSSILEKYPSHEYMRVFNTTGGFKAVSFYMTILGMLEGATIKYLFESSDQIIELPATPFFFNIESFYRLGPVAEKMLYGAIDEAELIWITGRSREQLKGEFNDILVWQPHGKVTLSAIARLIYIRLMQNKQGSFIFNFPKT
ncbi:putative CRISPR-associated protein [Paenactinomyces guangxiensis]|uniref:Putative CRISPR-associated protein n=1 Tax=Paenactinomyces guangxiensis TaxID=1490290 RepID=A0A7W1WUL5_9BACL|nr:putative CRISPR-associated protein [Paenactinomyces guangxiensis]MBA4496345.1 putative CRISPR-associated protein [Paenactinomyces guangxiensis]MBH8593629.1 putative CRISPR-associated protein [Paenactinomyces guangxiensis]